MAISPAAIVPGRLFAYDDSAEPCAAEAELWRDNRSALRTTAARSFAVREIVPPSEDLSLLSATALDARDIVRIGNRRQRDGRTRRGSQPQTRGYPRRPTISFHHE